MSSYRHEEIQEVVRLLNECRELGDDASIWAEHFARGIMRLVDADVIGAGHIGDLDGRKYQNLGAIDAGWERGFNRQGWLNALGKYAVDPLYHKGMTAGYQSVARGEAMLLSRRQYTTDREWYRSVAYDETTGLMGFDDEMCGFFPIGTAPGDMQCLIIYRDKIKPRFKQRDRNRLRLLMDLARPMIGGPLAGFREIRPTELPPRVRQVLVCTLEGDSDKQIAARLKISANTVHQYMKQIYRHFGVAGRNELLSRWLRRGWGARCAWRRIDLPEVETIGP